MNTLKNVYKKLQEDKTELKSERVELALVDDLKDLIKRGRKIESDLSSELNKYNGLLRAGDGFLTKYKELGKSANELGVPVPSELKKLENIAQGFIKKGNALKHIEVKEFSYDPNRKKEVKCVIKNFSKEEEAAKVVRL